MSRRGRAASSNPRRRHRKQKPSRQEIDSYEVAAKWPDPVLTSRCQPVEVSTKAERRQTQDLCRRLAHIVAYDRRSVGMAAPQIGVSLRVLAVRAPDRAVHALVNPTIVEFSEEKDDDVEGCFSLRDVWINVVRSREVKIEAEDMHGRPMKFTAGGFFSRILQHEIDHLDGRVILHTGYGKVRTEAEWLEEFKQRPRLDARNE